MTAAIRKPLPPSLYADTARPAPPTPPLQGDRRAKVAIVGGGFTGLSSALHLAERGIEAVVLEAQEPGWGASGRNGGQVNPGLKPDPDEVERDHGAELGQRMIAMSYGAPDLVFDLIRRHGIDCDARQTATMRVAFHESQAGAIESLQAQCARRAMPVDRLDAASLRERTGTGRYVAGLVDRRGGHLNPLGYARGLAEAAQRAGAAVHGATPVLKLARDGTAWRLETPGGTVQADTVILATNGYTDGLWPGLKRSIVPAYSAIVASEPLTDNLAASIMPCRSSLYEIGQVTVYYRLDAKNRVLMGGRSWSHDIAGAEALGFLSQYTTRLWPALATLRWTHGWNGQVALTPDHYPHLHELAPGLWSSLGYNGRGVAMATAMGVQLSRRIAEGPDAVLDMPVSPLRTIPLHAFWRAGVAARIVYGRLRDAVGI
jgi:glycine/D-amino acid oxidase-like deaminating enzyme